MLGPLSSLGLALVLACGASESSIFSDPAPVDDAGTDDGAASGDFAPGSNDAGGASTGDGGFEVCASDSAEAEPLPVDLLLLYDTSGSMAQPATATLSRHQLLVDGLERVLKQPRFANVGLAMQTFPLLAPGVPRFCTKAAENECTSKGAGGCSTYLTKRCTKSFNQPCGDNDVCTYAGIDTGPCVAVTKHTCFYPDSCNPADYAKLAVPFGQAALNATSILEKLSAAEPYGFTPTYGALKGALEAAAAQKAAHPTHVVAVVLATDGAPSSYATTTCTTAQGTPQDPNTVEGKAQLAAIVAEVKKVASDGLKAGIKTYVVAANPADELAKFSPLLDKVAEGGGTAPATTLVSDATGADKFAEAIDKIRAAELPCDYAIPPSTKAGAAIDFDKVNVRFASGGGATSDLVARASAEACTDTGGWYYDVDPARGTPKRIALCPSTCTAVKNDPTGGKVSLLLGCDRRPR